MFNNNSNEVEKFYYAHNNSNKNSKPLQKEHQGVICGSFEYLSTRYYQIFDVELGFLFAKEKDTSLTCSNCSWVVYNFIEVETGIRGMKYKALNVYEVEGNESKNPATNEFKNNNQFDFNQKMSIDFFDFDTNNNVLLFKTWITYCEDKNGFGYFTNSFYGYVEVRIEDLKILRKYGFQKIEALIELKSFDECQKSQCKWKLRNVMFEGKSYSMNGFLSVNGKLSRGTDGHVVPHEQIRIQPDALCPKFSHSIRSPAANSQGRNQKSGRSKNKEFGLGAIFGSGHF
ncbi:unnamed protein product [Caenorhabditis angaria]|uniref:Uncharacterized protein n=1 Tax=Caenorhabditis angaria TaxID=860376 RepID=A0A9P1I2U7_9PELO|nr:unnamed protein product [Caenorhabditis angaria]